MRAAPALARPTILDTPYRDARAADLTLALDSPPRVGLARLEVLVDDVRVDVRVLGASHQIRVQDGTAGVVETLACDAEGDPLPAMLAARPSGEGSRGSSYAYAFASRVLHPDAPELNRMVAELVARSADDPNAIAAAFPGRPEAVTAVRVTALDGGVRWDTWHAYPDEGELVVTASRLRRTA